MKIKRVLSESDPRLRAPNADVAQGWEDLAPLVRQMFKVMYRSQGVGLAAPQVGWNVRLFVMNPDDDTKKPEAQRVFWNPKITLMGEPKLMNEGCLSVPGITGDIRRFEAVRLEAMSPAGAIDEVFEGFAAQIIQHEVGHLSGKICVDEFVRAK
jgi:peptide deformylase